MKEQLAVRVTDDGTWLEFNALNGLSALIRVESLADEKGPIVASALKAWCADRQAEAKK